MRNNNARDELVKLAGGGSRVMKSFERMLERQFLAKNPEVRELPRSARRKLINEHVRDQLESAPYINTERNVSKGLGGLPFGRRKGSETTYFTQGPQTYNESIKRRRNPVRGRLKSIDQVPYEDIRNMRGKFSTDHMMANYPVNISNASDSYIFRGRLPMTGGRISNEYAVSPVQAYHRNMRAQNAARKRGAAFKPMMVDSAGDLSYASPFDFGNIPTSDTFVQGPTLRNYFNRGNRDAGNVLHDMKGSTVARGLTGPKTPKFLKNFKG